MTRLDSRNFNDSTENLEFSSLPVLTYYGLLDRGLSYPNGTFDAVAYESVGAAADPPQNATIIADTLGFFPELDCEIAKLNSTLQPHNSTTANNKQSDLFVTFTVPNCTTKYNAWTNILCDPHWEKCPDRAVLSLWGQTGNEIVGEVCNVGPDDTRVVFAVVDMRYKQTGLTSENSEAETWSTEIANMSGALCKPKYSIKNATISLDLQRSNSK